jgi:hypothetical protein
MNFISKLRDAMKGFFALVLSKDSEVSDMQDPWLHSPRRSWEVSAFFRAWSYHPEELCDTRIQMQTSIKVERNLEGCSSLLTSVARMMEEPRLSHIHEIGGNLRCMDCLDDQVRAFILLETMEVCLDHLGYVSAFNFLTYDENFGVYYNSDKLRPGRYYSNYPHEGDDCKVLIQPTSFSEISGVCTCANERWAIDVAKRGAHILFVVTQLIQDAGEDEESVSDPDWEEERIRQMMRKTSTELEQEHFEELDEELLRADYGSGQ